MGSFQSIHLDHLLAGLVPETPSHTPVKTFNLTALHDSHVGLDSILAAKPNHLRGVVPLVGSELFRLYFGDFNMPGEEFGGRFGFSREERSKSAAPVEVNRRISVVSITRVFRAVLGLETFQARPGIDKGSIDREVRLTGPAVLSIHGHESGRKTVQRPGEPTDAPDSWRSCCDPRSNP